MRNRCFIKILMLLLFSMFSNTVMANQALNMTIDRSWGLLLGDEVNVHIDLSSTNDNIDVESLPQQDKRYGNWLYLKKIEQSPQQLVFHYQVVNVPAKNTVINTPEFNVKLQNDEWIVVSPASLTIGPALATGEKGGTGKLIAKPDFSPALINTTVISQQLKLFSMIVMFSALVLALWHFGWKPKNRQPFAQALHDLSRLKWQRAVEPDQASRILHSAFNRTAGTIVIFGELEQLFEQRPWLEPLKNDIEVFYKRSAEHFFTRESAQEPDLDEVKKLAKACRSKEKMA